MWFSYQEINDQKTNDLSLLKQPAFLSASRMRVTFKVYSSLKEFVNDFTVVGDLTFNEIEFVFRCYFSSLAVILGICLVHTLLSFCCFSFRLKRLINLVSAKLNRLKRLRKSFKKLFRKMRRSRMTHWNSRSRESGWCLFRNGFFPKLCKNWRFLIATVKQSNGKPKNREWFIFVFQFGPESPALKW